MTKPAGIPSPHREVSSPEVLGRRPRVSVLTITYNHGAYIAECIRGFLAQRTNFDVEMVIGEDCSRDDTREVCRRLQAEAPERLRLLLPDANVGRFANFRAVLAACRGEFIALLEGDDVWTAPDKLQRQVDLLDAHREWSGCFHNVSIETIGGTEPPRPFFPAEEKTVFGPEDLVSRNFIPTCSCVFRNRSPLGLPAWYYDEARNPYSDWILHAINMRHGGYGYIHETMAVHRRHSGGVWGSTFDGTTAGDIRRMRMRQTAFEGLQQCLDPRLEGAVRRQRAMNAFHLSLAYREAGDRARAWRSLWQAFRADRSAEIPFLRSAAATLLRGGAKRPGAAGRSEP